MKSLLLILIAMCVLSAVLLASQGTPECALGSMSFDALAFVFALRLKSRLIQRPDDYDRLTS